MKVKILLLLIIGFAALLSAQPKPRSGLFDNGYLTNAGVYEGMSYVIVTNTTEFRTNVTESPYSPDVSHNVILNYPFRGNSPEPREKWVTTYVIRSDKITFQWRGKMRTVEDAFIVKTNTVHLRRKEEWEEVK